jgi:Sulfotransferase domain
MDCGVANYLDLSLLTFEAECRKGHAWGGEVVSYDHSVAVAKAVHLIRDPFDNIVGRMHLGSAHQQSRGEAGFNHSQQGLEDWCSYLDEKYHDQDESSHALDMDLPCRAEWYRYIQWHNLAAEVTEKIPHVLHMYYDNYTTNYEGTVTQLLDFLELEARHEPLFFQANKTYLEYFSLLHRQQAARFAQRFATEKSWKLLAHYFEPYLTTGSTSQRERPLDDDDQVVTSDSGTENEIDAGSEVGEVALNFTYNERSEVVWLMSFPNSVSCRFACVLMILILSSSNHALAIFALGNIVHSYEYGEAEPAKYGDKLCRRLGNLFASTAGAQGWPVSS